MNIPINSAWNVVYKITITNMATVRNFVVISYQCKVDGTVGLLSTKFFPKKIQFYIYSKTWL
jgi:hypothetical protein